MTEATAQGWRWAEQIVKEEWHRAVEEFSLRPGSYSETLVARILERLAAAAPTVSAQFVCEENGWHGSTDAPVKGVSWADDGTLIVEIDHWPQQAAPADEPSDAVERSLGSKPDFYGDDPVEQLAFELAFELEEADMNPGDLVTLNRDKLRAIAARVVARAAPANFELCHCGLSSEVHVIRAGETGCELCDPAERLKPDADAVEGVLRGYQHRVSVAAAPADELVAALGELAPELEELREEDIQGYKRDDDHALIPVGTLRRLREALARHRAQPSDCTAEDSRSIGEWADETFGPVTDIPRAVERAEEEFSELKMAAQTGDAVAIVEEAADVVIVLMRLAHTLGSDLQAAIDFKMAKNRARTWRSDGTGHGYHIKPAAIRNLSTKE